MNDYREEQQDKEWERISGVLKAADRVPDAPDCRAAVMARIAKPKPLLRYRWALGTCFAGLILAAIGLRPFVLSPEQGRTITQAPKKHQAAPLVEPKPPLYASTPKPAQQSEPPRSYARRIRREKPVMMAMAQPNARARVQSESGAAKGATSANRDWDDARAYWSLDGQEAEPAVAESKRGFEAGSLRADHPSSAPAAPSRSAGEEVALGVTASTDTRARNSVGYSLTDTAAAPISRGLDVEAATANATVPPASTDADVTVARSTGGTTVTGRLNREKVLASSAAPIAGDDAGLYFDRMSVAGSADLRIAETPLAVAMVTWPSAGRPADTYDYAYTNRDTTTGHTTECRVKRSGNSVEIYLESKPPAPAPPVKGSLDYDTTPNV